MTIVPVQSAKRAEASTVTLARYAAIVQYPECQFWGVRNDATLVDSECRTIWLKSERDNIAYYLAEAQEEIEREMRHPVGYKWFEDERQSYALPLLAKWGEVVEGGVRAVDPILPLGKAVNHATDPAVVGPFATTVTDEDELQVQYPATLVEGEIVINPSDIDIALGFATIYIPRCRMVLPSLVDNDRQGVDYDDPLNFLQTVDVVRVYNDASTHATLVWPHACNCLGICTCNCDDYQRDGCIYVRQGRIGAVDVLPATYSGGSWSAAVGCCGTAEYVLLNYRAGVDMTRQMEDAIVRLAHSKMPDEPCGCVVVQRLWKRDREEPGAFTRERVNCPFGTNQGAWIAWRFTQAMELRRGGGL